MLSMQKMHNSDHRLTETVRCFLSKQFTGKRPRGLGFWQQHAFTTLATYAKQHSPFYREHFKDVDDFSSRLKFPLVTRADLQAGHGQVAIPDQHSLAYRNTGSTGGSTGEPLTFFCTPYAGKFLDIEQKYIYRKLWRPLLWDGYHEQALMYHTHMVQLEHHRNWQNPQQLFVNPHHLHDNPRHIVEAIMDWRPLVISCYASFVVELAQHTERLGLAGSFTVPYLILNGEAATPEQQAYVREVFGGKTISRYGLEETYWSIASEDGHQPGLVPYYENVLIEVIDETGQPCPVGKTGRVIVTDLTNYVHPFIRYETGDLAEVLESDGPYLRFAITGRTTSLAIGEVTFTHHFANEIITPHSKQIERYQFQKLSKQHLRLQLVPLHTFRPETEAKIAAAVQRTLGATNTFTIEIVDDLPRSAVGKTRPFVDLSM